MPWNWEDGKEAKNFFVSSDFRSLSALLDVVAASSADRFSLFIQVPEREKRNLVMFITIYFFRKFLGTIGSLKDEKQVCGDKKNNWWDERYHTKGLKHNFAIFGVCVSLKDRKFQRGATNLLERLGLLQGRRLSSFVKNISSFLELERSKRRKNPKTFFWIFVYHTSILFCDTWLLYLPSILTSRVQVTSKALIWSFDRLRLISFSLSSCLINRTIWL